MLPDDLKNGRRLGRVGNRRKDDVTSEIVLKLVPMGWVQIRFEEPPLADDSGGTFVYRVAAFPDVTINANIKPSARRKVGNTDHMKLIRATVIGGFRGDVIGRCPQLSLWRRNSPRDTAY